MPINNEPPNETTKEAWDLLMPFEVAVEAGAIGMYGPKWNDPREDHRPGEKMKEVWRKYSRDCLTAAMAAGVANYHRR